MESIQFTKEQSDRIFKFLVAIQNRDFLDIARNDSSSAYWNIENQVDDLVEQLFMEWGMPFYEIELLKFNKPQWRVYRITDRRCEYVSEFEDKARHKLEELNKPFIK